MIRGRILDSPQTVLLAATALAIAADNPVPEKAAGSPSDGSRGVMMLRGVLDRTVGALLQPADGRVASQIAQRAGDFAESVAKQELQGMVAQAGADAVGSAVEDAMRLEVQAA